MNLSDASFPLFESLESRELLSASLPQVTGSYSGSVDVTKGKDKGNTGTITMDITGQTAKGVLSGTYTFLDFSGNFQGKVNKADKIVGAMIISGKKKIAFAGKFSAGTSTDTITGKAHGGKNAATFSETT